MVLNKTIPFPFHIKFRLNFSVLPLFTNLQFITNYRQDKRGNALHHLNNKQHFAHKLAKSIKTRNFASLKFELCTELIHADNSALTTTTIQ